MQTKSNLKARLGLADATLLVMGASIGSGLFLTTGIIASHLPDAGWIILVWIIGSIITLFGGLTFAELGTMMPQAGGQYVYLKETYGPAAGFMYGWTNFMVTHTGGIAALGVGFAEYLSHFFPQLGLNHFIPLFGGLQISFGQLVAVSSILALSVVNYFGIRSGSTVQNIFTVVKILAIVLLVIAGLYLIASRAPFAPVAHQPAMPAGWSRLAAFGVALIAVLWTFDGWYSVNCVASEIKNVKENLPLSLMLGIILTGVLYVLVNLFYVNALPINEISGVVRIGEKSTSFVFGSKAGSAMSALILLSILGCLSATIIFGPRIFYAMAKDGLFFRSIARVHPRFNTPTRAIVWQAGWASILCLTGTYEQLYTYVVFVLLFFYVATVLAVFILRFKRPTVHRPYNVWGYPIVPALFGASMLWIMVNTLIEKPAESVWGLIFLLSGLPVYLFWRRRSPVSEN